MILICLLTILKCDELFIDGLTDQNAVRIMTQEQVEHELIELIQELNIHSRSIRIHAKTGIVMRGLKLISEN